MAGFFNPVMRIEGRPAAYFGYWESLDEVETNRRLFREFESWARSQGAEVVYGPVNFTTFGDYRVRLNRFDAGCFFGEPYNPPYYPRLLESLGYELAIRYESITGRLKEPLDTLREKMPPATACAEELGVTLLRVTPEHWLESLGKLYANCDPIFSGNFGYTGIAFETFQKYFGEPFAARLCPKSSVLALDRDGNLAGFIIAFPDYAPLCRQGSPKRIRLSEIRYEEHFPMLASPMGIAKSGGVHPRYRKEGLYWIMTLAMADWAEPYYPFAAGATIREDNPTLAMAKQVFTGPDDIVRAYGLFARSLE
jgi:hypothetical protein